MTNTLVLLSPSLLVIFMVLQVASGDSPEIEFLKNDYNIRWFLYYLDSGSRSRENVGLLADIDYYEIENTCSLIYIPSYSIAQSVSCHEYNSTFYTSSITISNIPEDFRGIGCRTRPSYRYGLLTNLTSKYCPNMNETENLIIQNDTNAVYNQQARFNCSKGELYDGSSINSDYYRTCQFDARWSGEMPQCFTGPLVNTILPSSLISQQSATFLCGIIGGNPKVFNMSLELENKVMARNNVGMGTQIYLDVNLLPSMHGKDLTCVVSNLYTTAIVKTKLDVLFGPTTSNGEITVMGEAEFNKPLTVVSHFISNPSINHSTTRLVNEKGDIIKQYEITNHGGIKQSFEWKLQSFTSGDEGTYTLTMWSSIASEILRQKFTLKAKCSVETTTASLATSSSCSGGSLILILVIAIPSLVVGLVVGVIGSLIAFKRTNEEGNFQRETITGTTESAVESHYEIPMSCERTEHVETHNYEIVRPIRAQYENVYI